MVHGARFTCADLVVDNGGSKESVRADKGGLINRGFDRLGKEARDDNNEFVFGHIGIAGIWESTALFPSWPMENEPLVLRIGKDAPDETSGTLPSWLHERGLPFPPSDNVERDETGGVAAVLLSWLTERGLHFPPAGTVARDDSGGELPLAPSDKVDLDDMAGGLASTWPITVAEVVPT